MISTTLGLISMGMETPGNVTADLSKVFAPKPSHHLLT